MHIAIVGAGVMGLTLAFYLLQAGYCVTIYDRPRKKNERICSDVAAGMLCPVAELENADKIIYAIGQEAIQRHWPEILAALPEAVYFRALGSLLVAHRHDAAELNRVVRHLKMCDSQIKQLDAQALQQLEPELTRCRDAYYLTDEAQVDTQHYMKMMKIFLKKNNVLFIEKEINHVKNEVVAYHYVVDCRGLGAKKAFTDLYAVRGEIIWVEAKAVNVSRPIRFVHPKYRLYIVPRPHHLYLLGASEIYTEDLSEISVRTLLELLTAAYAVHPGFLEARILKTATHCRPTLANGLPTILVENNVIRVNGLYRHGFLLAPTLANEVLQYILWGQQAICYQALWTFL